MTPPTQPSAPPPAAAAAADGVKSTAGLTDVKSLDDWSERIVDEIEMIGEERAAGMPVGRTDRSHVTPAMRYLHCSRTIHQLVTDRNRAVGIYLAVASLLWTASTALLNVKENVVLPVPLKMLQYWCVPVTLGACTLLAFFTAFLLIRTRIGLIYEVAKMNALMGLPIGRVQRVNVLSLFFIMHLMVCVAGGGCSALFSYHLFHILAPDFSQPMVASLLLGVVVTTALVALYVFTVMVTTADEKLSGAAHPEPAQSNPSR
jgi:hypothetical protein